ncbi:MAG: zinc ribbon domain-containing protein [Clostridia bacterium]|nr:zinc ribbon domain-containing protein [Clostridia bacterium]
MYCKNCGKLNDDDARFCSSCGEKLESDYYHDCDENDCRVEDYERKDYQRAKYGEVNENDAPSVGYGILSFFIPIVGIILFVTWNKQSPKKAKSCIIGAIIGIVVTLIFEAIGEYYLLPILEEWLESYMGYYSLII